MATRLWTAAVPAGPPLEGAARVIGSYAELANSEVVRFVESRGKSGFEVVALSAKDGPRALPPADYGSGKLLERPVPDKSAKRFHSLAEADEEHDCHGERTDGGSRQEAHERGLIPRDGQL